MNNGINNENNIINSLNGKAYLELNNNLKTFIRYLFKDIKDNDVIISGKIKGVVKVDIFVEVNSNKKYISIKSGSENSIHAERIDSFILFLKENKVKDTILDYLKLYHFGDNTTNGTGLKRYSAEECKFKYFKEIMIFNKYVSYNNLLIKIIDRFLFIGNKNNKYIVDALYYGNENYAIWANREEILDYLTNNKCYYIRTIHFSSLTYQNLCRNIDKRNKSEHRRNYLQIKWFSIVSDLQKIRELYNC